jgi:Cu2+-exporting ATPase
VTAVEINYATRRARVRWDERRIKLSDILAAIAAIGYRAYPYDAAKSEETGAPGAAPRAVAGVRRRFRHDAGDDVRRSGVFRRRRRDDAGGRTVDALGEPGADGAGGLLFGGTLFRNAWRDLRLRRAGMDVPVALGIGAAFAASVWATLTASGEVYFDSVTMFVFFLLSGRFLK